MKWQFKIGATAPKKLLADMVRNMNLALVEANNFEPEKLAQSREFNVGSLMAIEILLKTSAFQATISDSEIITFVVDAINRAKQSHPEIFQDVLSAEHTKKH